MVIITMGENRAGKEREGTYWGLVGGEWMSFQWGIWEALIDKIDHTMVCKPLHYWLPLIICPASPTTISLVHATGSTVIFLQFLRHSRQTPHFVVTILFVWNFPL